MAQPGLCTIMSIFLGCVTCISSCCSSLCMIEKKVLAVICLGSVTPLVMLHRSPASMRQRQAACTVCLGRGRSARKIQTAPCRAMRTILSC